MGYGAEARRVPARAGAILSDVDIYKIMLLCKTERGIVDSSGDPVVHDEIYSMNDFYAKCGGFKSSSPTYYGAFIARSFFKELEKGLGCEMKTISPVAANAVQAGYDILDGSGAKIFDIDAGCRNLIDKSAFGNKIAIKITHVEEITMKLTTALADSATTCVLDSVDNLEVGNYIKFTEGSDTEVRAITSIVPATKTVGFAAITESGGFSTANTTVTRLDWKLEVAVKDDKGNYEKKEEWKLPFAKSNTIGLASSFNNTDTGSEYAILTVASANASLPENKLPAELTSWTAFTSGADGTAAVDADWKTLAEDYVAGQEFTILLAPESTSITHNQNMSDFCTDDYKGMYYAQSSNAATEATLKNFGASMRGSVKFSMLPSDKWIETDDPTVTNGKIDIPKVGVDAAHWFNTYYKYGESKVAAGNKTEMVLKCSDVLLDSNALVHDDRGGVGNRLIRNYSVNICRYTRGKGITNNSARTFSTDAGYMYQNQIMAFLLYSRSILAYLRLIEQDKSGYNAQESHYAQVWAYMKKKFDAGHLFVGKKEDGSLTTFKDVCVIVNDFTVNTLVNIANGIEETFLQFCSPPPIESPILSLASASVTSVVA
jgi:hypothetical protein